MDNQLPANNLGKKHAVELYQSQELRQQYLQKRNQFLLQASGILLLGAMMSFGMYSLSQLFQQEFQNFGVGATIFISVISFLGFVGYQSQFVFKRKNLFLKDFKSEVIKNIVQSLYPELSYSRSGKVPLEKLLKTNRYSSYYVLKSWNNQDAISGHYPDLDFTLLESTVHGIPRYDDDGRTYRKVFTGLIMHIHTQQSKKDLDIWMSSSEIKKKLKALSNFWGSYPQVSTFYDGDIIIDIVLLKKHFLEPPKVNTSIYDPSYIEQLSLEISLLVELILEIRAQINAA